MSTLMNNSIPAVSYSSSDDDEEDFFDAEVNFLSIIQNISLFLFDKTIEETVNVISSIHRFTSIMSKTV